MLYLPFSVKPTPDEFREAVKAMRRDQIIRVFQQAPANAPVYVHMMYADDYQHLLEEPPDVQGG